MGNRDPESEPPGSARPLPSPDLRPSPRPLRIGIWCDFGQTLLPHEGIGVFVHSLARGLLALDEPVALTMVTHPGEQEVMEDLQAEAPDRVHVLPEPNRLLQFRRKEFRHLWTWIRVSSWLGRRAKESRARWGRWLGRPKTLGKDWVKALASRGRPGLAALAAVAALVVVPLWAAFAVGRLLQAAADVALYPLMLVDQVARRLWVSGRLFTDHAFRDIIRSGDCDVWIIPYVGFEYPIDFPAVVVIHDLVVFHFPEMFEPRFVNRLREIVPQRAAEAAICACMSNFIKDSDLYGQLKLSPDKVRVVRPAAPGDIPRMSREEAAKRRPPFLRRPYLFLPSAFRGYKNHAGLIEALHVLQRDHGEDGFDLVFTGRIPHELPTELDALARRLGVSDRIHVLGRVSRLDLTALYREAFATLMPSLYEQGSFPVYEALVSGCPVACSDIPSLREQCAAMGDAMLYFDPYDPAAIARAVLAIRADRDGVRKRQRDASPSIWSRTWAMAAAEWLPVLREAAERGRPVARVPEVRREVA